METNKTTKPGVVMQLYKAMRCMRKRRFNICAKIMYFIIYLLFNCVIPPEVEIEDGSRIAHGVGIVMHPTTNIGKNAVIYQNVSIANRNVVIGDNVLIGAGAVILGPCKIGNGVKIGANTFINFDVPDNSTVVGSKGRIIE